MKQRMIWAVLLALALCSAGCAFPHRSGYCYDEVRTYQGRRDGLVRIEIRKDREGGGGLFFLSTSQVQSLVATHANQKALGGGSSVAVGPFQNATDPQASKIIESTGVAVGELVKKAAGVP
jgi:hypothetical protein